MKASQLSEKKMARRGFMKGAALAAGGMMVGGLPIEASAYVNPSAPKLRLAVVGCGGRGTGAAVQALNADPDVELVAMHDAFRDRIDGSLRSILASDELKADRKKNVKVGEEGKFTGFDGYKKAIAECDVVILTAPPGFRPYHLEEAVMKGKHVFCEKPLATDAPGIRKCLELLDISKQKKLNIVVGLQRHYETSYRELIKRIHDGAIGDVVSGQVYWNGDGVWVNPRKSGQSELDFQMRNWYYFNWLCGDHIVEQHVHNLDVFNWVKQAYPVRAQGMGGREVRKGPEYGEIFDHHYVEFEYADGTFLNSQCRHIKGCFSKVYETVIGTKGRAESNGSIVDLKGNSIYRHRGDKDPNPYQQEHDELFASIRSGGVINDIEFGAKSTMTAILGRFATYSGQMVTWDEALNSNVQLMPAMVDWNTSPPSLPDADGYYPIAVPGKTKPF
jgi:myo-inositol 2-dehydrogenase / D-chiro-inositol 1-dehydrogenase